MEKRKFISSENFIYENVIMCKLDKFDIHVLKHPKVPPCGK
jgi:hypothetical protein